MAVPKSLMRKKKRKEKEQTLAELNPAHRHLGKNVRHDVTYQLQLFFFRSLINYITIANLHNTDYLYNKGTRGKPIYNLGRVGGGGGGGEMNPMNKICSP